MLTGVAALTLRAQVPSWVEQRPSLPGYYVGIGSAAKTGALSDDQAAARNQALNDIATQISVTISGEVLREVVERNDSLRTQMTSLLRASARADFEDIELVGTYGDATRTWCYVRVNREAYRRRHEQKVRAAAGMSADLLTKGKDAEKAGNVVLALRSYAQALSPLQNYLNEAVTAEIGGKSVYLAQEAYASLQRVLDEIALQPPQVSRTAKVGKPLKPAFELTARRSGDGPVRALPVQFSFLKGAGEHPREMATDDHGAVRCDIRKITSPERLQIVEGKVSVGSLLGSDTTSLVSVLLSTLAVPRSRLMLDVAGLEVAFESDETILDRPLEQKRIEPAIKARIVDQGFSFVDRKDRASVLISIKARARKGSETMGLSFAYVTVDVSVLDLESGREVFRKVLSDVKEGSDTFEKAAQKGFATAAARIGDELVPQLVARVQQ